MGNRKEERKAGGQEVRPEGRRKKRGREGRRKCMEGKGWRDGRMDGWIEGWKIG